MNEQLTKLIEQFLTERRESDGGWAEVKPKDVKTLYKILDCLIELKFEADPDGDFPIGYELIDRTNFENNQFQPVPYSHIPRRERDNLRSKEEIAADEAKRESASFEVALFNLNVAMDRFSSAYKIRRYKQK